MKHLKLTVFLTIITAMFAVSAQAQRKPTKRPAPKKAPVKIVPPLEVRTAREKVENQLSNVNLFVDKFGPIAQDLDEISEAASSRPLSGTAAEKHEANKRAVVKAIQGLKTALAELETEFRNKPSLQKYLSAIQGISDLAIESEDLAIANRFVASKEPLREVSKKLADTLASMPY